MSQNASDLLQKNFIRSTFYFQKSFKESKKRNEILKEILQDNVKKEILSVKDNLLGCKILLNKSQEQHLFRKYNYLKYRIFQISKDKKIGISKKRLEIEKRLFEINQIREILIKCNMKLIVKCVCNHFRKDSPLYDEFFSNSYLHMMRAIDCFDFRKKFKFSTYFVNVLYRNLYRDKISIKSYVDYNFELDGKESQHTEYSANYNQSFIKKALEMYSENDESKKRSIVIKKFYGVCGEKKHNDKEIAKQLNISKSRVQQLRKSGLDQIKKLKLVYDPVF